MQNRQIQEVLILGGGTAGWMSAALLARFLRPMDISVRLVESEEIGSVGVGEGTVPIIRKFNGLLGIDEKDFLRATKGSLKLGIEFVNWGHIGNRFFHAFADYGDPIEGISAHHHWLKLRGLGDTTPVDDYSFSAVAISAQRFAPPPKNIRPGLPAFDYAYHFDATLYARVLREYAENLGVVRREGKVEQVSRRADNGFIESITLQSGERVEADLFIDCSGQRSLLLGDTLQNDFVSFRHWLPCDRAIAAPSSGNSADFAPATRSTAHASGWQWRIPLQHRTGNGLVYSSQFTSDADAETLFRSNLDSELLAEPKLLQFEPGHRKKFWDKNCVAIGLSAGFMEPLESTSIQLIQTGLARLIEFYPDRNFDQTITDEYNRVTKAEFERIRDFLILHYCIGSRDDSALWQSCRKMPLPDTLQYKIDLFRSCGRIPLSAEDSYREPSWTALLLGLGVIPQRYDPIVDRIPTVALQERMNARSRGFRKMAETLPTHKQFIEHHISETTTPLTAVK